MWGIGSRQTATRHSLVFQNQRTTDVSPLDLHASKPLDTPRSSSGMTLELRSAQLMVHPNARSLGLWKESKSALYSEACLATVTEALSGNTMQDFHQGCPRTSDDWVDTHTDNTWDSRQGKEEHHNLVSKTQIPYNLQVAPSLHTQGSIPRKDIFQSRLRTQMASSWVCCWAVESQG